MNIRVQVTRQIKASRERVFDTWLDPKMIGEWMFGPSVRDEEVLRITMDARVGGTFSFLVRRQGVEIDHIGEYLVIDRPRQLAFTWGVRQDLPNTSRVRIDMVPRETECQLTLNHELHPDWADYAGRVEASWTKMLDSLAAALG